MSRSLCGLPARCGSTPCQMVGTPAVKVTPSSMISFARFSGCIIAPGMTSEAPAAGAACAIPQALAWNIGTTGIATSRMPSPNALGIRTPMVCRNVERCE